MRKIIAIASSIITILLFKELVYIHLSSDPELIQKRTQYTLVVVSLALPMLLLSFWLWRGKRNKPNDIDDLD